MRDIDNTFDDAAVARILEAVGQTKQGAELAKRVDRDKLAQQLRDAVPWWITYSAAAYFASSRADSTQI